MPFLNGRKKGVKGQQSYMNFVKIVKIVKFCLFKAAGNPNRFLNLSCGSDGIEKIE
jgi:hypothetical protein